MNLKLTDADAAQIARHLRGVIRDAVLQEMDRRGLSKDFLEQLMKLIKTRTRRSL